MGKVREYPSVSKKKSVRISTNQSILAWEFDTDLEDRQSYVAGFLSDSPKHSARCGNMKEILDPDDEPRNLASAVINIELNITTRADSSIWHNWHSFDLRKIGGWQG
jgi:hypothetical protein